MHGPFCLKLRIKAGRKDVKDKTQLHSSLRVLVLLISLCYVSLCLVTVLKAETSIPSFYNP